MGRPKADPTAKKTRVIGAKLSESEGVAWEELRRSIGSGSPLLPRDTDVIRHLIGEECRRRGVHWPVAGSSTQTTNRRARKTHAGAKAAQ